MKKKTINFISPLLFIGIFMFFAISCKKDNNNNGVTIGMPIVSTTYVSDITQTTSKCGGLISIDGGSTISARGVCWSIGKTPTILDYKTIDGTGAGVFYSTLIGLSPNTTYYVRAYATNSNGTNYGSTMSFTTKPSVITGSFTDSRDGNIYKTVTIGNQVWMAENLKFLPSVVAPSTGSKTIAYYYVYDYNGTNDIEAKSTSNYNTYGVLYNWTAAMNGSSSSTSNPSNVQGVCPAGWHLPSDVEWTILTDNLGGSIVAGGKLKDTGITQWSYPNPGSTNETGFTALPSGYRDSGGTFNQIGSSGSFWRSTENNGNNAYYSGMYYDSKGISRNSTIKERGISVRCVKD